MQSYAKIAILLCTLTLVNISSLYAFDIPDNEVSIISNNLAIDSLFQVHKQVDSIERQELIKLNESALQNNSVDSVTIYKSLAVLYAKNNNALESSKHITHYMRATQDMSILNDHIFSNINNTSEYLDLKNAYKPKLGISLIFYAFTGFFGLLIFIVLNCRKKMDGISVLLISSFVLFNSLFILHVSIHQSRYYLQIPHSLFATASFSFLYGPLLYFYFKRIVRNHRFTLKDSMHLVPTLALIIFLIPYYRLNSIEKFRFMFDHANFVSTSVKIIAIFKIISLCFYAWATFKIYNKQEQDNKISKGNIRSIKKVWERNVLTIFICYVLAYILYVCAITKFIDYKPLFNLQIIVIAIMIFYIAAISLLQPEVFKGKIELSDLVNLFKYSKSGLTESYSVELKKRLLELMNKDKLFKQNDMNLDKLSEILGTTRHNASQVINEHFNMSFFELMNFYRIMEAQDILMDDKNRSLNIIDVAYEVGYNNKVTFNKAFKKQNNLTPTQYIRSLNYDARFLKGA